MSIIDVAGVQYRYTARPEQLEFADTESWEKKGFAAHWLAQTLQE